MQLKRNTKQGSDMYATAIDIDQKVAMTVPRSWVIWRDSKGSTLHILLTCAYNLTYSEGAEPLHRRLFEAGKHDVRCPKSSWNKGSKGGGTVSYR